MTSSNCLCMSISGFQRSLPSLNARHTRHLSSLFVPATCDGDHYHPDIASDQAITIPPRTEFVINLLPFCNHGFRQEVSVGRRARRWWCAALVVGGSKEKMRERVRSGLERWEEEVPVRWELPTILRVIVSGSFGGRIALASHCIGSILMRCNTFICLSLHIPNHLLTLFISILSLLIYFYCHHQVLQAQYPYALSPQGPQEVLVRQLECLQGQGRQAGP